MNNMENQKRDQTNSTVKPANPDFISPSKGVGPGETLPKRDLNQTEDSQATEGRREFGVGNSDENQENEKQDDKKRYDEADPRWTEPDVQMQKDEINPELEANIGPQS